MHWYKNSFGCWFGGDSRSGPCALVERRGDVPRRVPLAFPQPKYKAIVSWRESDGGWEDTWAYRGTVQAARKWAEREARKRHDPDYVRGPDDPPSGYIITNFNGGWRFGLGALGKFGGTAECSIPYPTRAAALEAARLHSARADVAV